MSIKRIKKSPFYLTTALCTGLFLASCTKDDSPAAILKLIEEGRSEKALELLQEQLNASPKDATVNTLALSAALEVCANQHCFAEETAPLLEQMTRYKQYTTEPVNIGETVLSLKNIADETVHLVFTETTTPETAIKALQALPSYAQDPYMIAITQRIKELLLKKDTEAALKWLHPMTREEVFTKDTRHIASYMYGLLIDKETFAKANLVALKSTKAQQLHSDLWGVLPLVWWIDTQTPEAFLNLYDTEIEQLLPLFSQKDKEAIASALNILSTFEKSKSIDLITRQLALNPNDIITWEAYLPALRAYLEQAVDATLLEKIDPLNVPEIMRVSYNTMLFELVPLYKQQNKNVLPLLKQVSLQDIPKPNLIRLEKLTQTGLEDALAQNNIKLVREYAQFRPSVAKENKHQIMPVMLDAIQADFEHNDFQAILDNNDFLIKDLEIDFDLKALLLNAFKAYLKTEKVSDALSATHPEWLLKDEPYNLGAKFGFLQTQFADTPEVTNNILKDLVGEAQGIYGTPTAFYRLMHLFNDSIFSQEEQHDYLRAAIQFSLENDTDLSGAALAGLGYKLYEKQGISLNFVALKALDRTDDLDSERLLWSGAPQDMKNAWQTDRPAFFTLMTAIDLFDKGQKAEAAGLFGRLANEYYLEQAQPYLDHYAKTVEQALGWYVPINPENTKIGFIGIAPQTSEVGTELTSLQVALINKVGSQSFYDRDTFVTNHAAVYKANIEGALNFDNNTISFTQDDKNNIVLPEPFDVTFSDITKLQLDTNNRLKGYVNGEKTPITFKRIKPKAGQPLFPDGTFTIQTAIEDPVNHAETILPVGAQLTLETNEAPVQLTHDGVTLPGIIFPIQGMLVHPLSPNKTFPIQGYYSPTKHLIQLTFDYPLNQTGRKATAAVRCQQQSDIIHCFSHHAHNNKHQYTAQSVGKRQ